MAGKNFFCPVGCWRHFCHLAGYLVRGQGMAGVLRKKNGGLLSVLSGLWPTGQPGLKGCPALLAYMFLIKVT